jgi:sulfopyruvate decarboxylase alpha subunit
MAQAKAKAKGKKAAQHWTADIFDVLKKFDVKQVAYVPDTGQAPLIESCRQDNVMRAIPLTTEEEGMGVLAGAYLGGERGAMLMQSSGAGNCINMLGVPIECRIPLLMVVTMRGEWGEFNPWQMPMSQGAQAAMEAVGVIVMRADDASRVGETVEAAAKMAYEGGRTVAVLIGQRVVGHKNWDR